MSAVVIPDLYRHTARKSTVSKTVKSTNISPCNFNQSSPTTYPVYCSTSNSNEESMYNALQCDIKLEEDLSPFEQPFLLLPDNEMEEMSMGDEREQTDDEIIQQIIDEIIQSIPKSNPFKRSRSDTSDDVRHVVNSMINQFDQIDEQEFSSDHIEENANTSSDEMESDQPPSTTSRSQTEDDVIEVEASSNQNSPHLCTCQCHKPSSPFNNEYLLFEQALKQARLEQQQDKSVANNRLIQTLKRQHEELLQIYQQKEKQTQKKTIDREQQTIKRHLHDSQIQTDLTTMNATKSPLQQKSIFTSTNNSHTNGTLTATRNHSISSNSISTSATSSSSSTTKTALRSAVNGKTTTTNAISNKTMVTSPPVPASTTVTSPDIVDLTEEDEDDGTTRVSSTQRTTPIRQPNIPSILPAPSSSTTTTTTTAATTTTSIRNRSTNPPNPPSNNQVFPLRPLPEHIPCDQTIARPQLSITQENATVRLTWNLPATPMESIRNYEIYAHKQNATATVSDWKKIGCVKSMRLPMAVTLKEFQSNSHYAFAVRAVSIDNRIGPFCEPKTIFTGNTSIQPLHPSQLLNVS